MKESNLKQAQYKMSATWYSAKKKENDMRKMQ